MNWKKLDLDKICCCYVLLGYWVEDYQNMVWQIGRKMNGKLEFFDKDHHVGPYAGDAQWQFEPEQTTHYLEIEIPDFD